jgi:hypothetical protein
MAYVVWALCIVASLSACGGGGGGSSDTSISVSQTTFTFNAELNQPAPAAQTITVSFQGDGVVAGTLPGQPVTPWLSITKSSQSANQVVFALAVIPAAMPVGAYSTTLRFASGHADGSNVKIADVTIAMNVVQGFAASSAPLNFTQVDGAASAQPAGGIAANITGDNISWRASANQPWIVLSASSGSTAALLTINVARQTLAVGSYTGTVQITDDRSGRVASLPVTYTIRAAALVVDKSSLSYTVTPATVTSQLSAAIQISDELNGANAAKDATWTAASDQSWLALSTTSGSTSPSATLTASVVPAAIALTASGTYNANINLSYKDSAGATGSKQIPVTMTLRMPLARAATPYLVSPSATTTVLVRGEDFQAADLALLRLDGVALTTSPSLVNATSLSLPLPALAAGRHLLTFATNTGIARSAAEVTAKALTTPTGGTIVTTNPKRLVYDAERARLYAVNRTTAQIERYDWNGSAWTTLPVLAVPKVRDAALTRSGHDLVIVTDDAVLLNDATDTAATPRQVATRTGPPPPVLGQAVWDNPNYVGVTDSGLALIAQTFPQGSGHTALLGFDTIRQQMISSAPIGQLFYEGRMAVSDDGHYAVIGGDGLSPAAEASLIDSRGSPSNVFGIQLNYPSGNYVGFDLGRDGSKVLENFVSVKDRSGQLLGSLPANPFAKLALDGTKAYVFNQTVAPGKIEIYDLTATPYVKAGEVVLPVRIIDPATQLFTYPSQPYDISAVISPDNKAMFLSGTESIVVVPLP